MIFFKNRNVENVGRSDPSIQNDLIPAIASISFYFIHLHIICISQFIVIIETHFENNCVFMSQEAGQSWKDHADFYAPTLKVRRGHLVIGSFVRVSVRQ